jgi:hypothetical protein
MAVKGLRGELLSEQRSPLTVSLAIATRLRLVRHQADAHNSEQDEPNAKQL